MMKFIFVFLILVTIAVCAPVRCIEEDINSQNSARFFKHHGHKLKKGLILKLGLLGILAKGKLKNRGIGGRGGRAVHGADGRDGVSVQGNDGGAGFSGFGFSGGKGSKHGYYHH